MLYGFLSCETSIFFLQYIHGLAARGVHYFHRPGPILQDVGFYLLPVSFLVFMFVSPPLLWELHTDLLCMG